MFERFTKRARTAVAEALDEAGRRRSGRVEPRHLLLALAADPEGIAGRALGLAGVDHAAVAGAVDRLPGGPPLDAAALATLGIDLDEVQRQAEASFGPGALQRATSAAGGRRPLAADTKRTLEQALREAMALRHRYIGTEHLLLGLLAAAPADVTTVLTDLGIAPDRLRSIVLTVVADVSRSA